MNQMRVQGLAGSSLPISRNRAKPSMTGRTTVEAMNGSHISAGRLGALHWSVLVLRRRPVARSWVGHGCRAVHPGAPPCRGGRRSTPAGIPSLLTDWPTAGSGSAPMGPRKRGRRAGSSGRPCVDRRAAADRLYGPDIPAPRTLRLRQPRAPRTPVYGPDSSFSAPCRVRQVWHGRSATGVDAANGWVTVNRRRRRRA
jgi:hypothetical protein